MTGCARGYRAHEVAYAPDRLTDPLIRTGPRGTGGFRRATWEEALDLVADRLDEIRTRYGPRSILALAGSGSCRGAVHNTSVLPRRFFSCFDSAGYTSTHGSFSSAAQSFVLPYLFGRSDIGIDPLTLERSKLIVLWGANIVDTRFGSDLERVVRRCRSKGTPVVAVDPRRSNTVDRLADEWIAIRPGTDAAMLSAMLHVLITEDLVDHACIEACTSGFEALQTHLLGTAGTGPADPEWAEPITGVSASIVRELARRFAASRPAALLPGLSIQRTIGGEEAVRLAVALQAATGNVGVEGGSPGNCVWPRLPNPRFGRIPAVPSAPDRPPPGTTHTVPVYRWADSILGNPDAADSRSASADETPIRAAYAVGVNYLATGSDITKSRRAFSSLDFAVCHDSFLTPTAAWCDVVFPTTTFLERNDVVFPAGNYLFYSARAIQPVGSSRDDYDILADLADRLGFRERFTEGRSAGEWLEHLIEDSAIEDPERFKSTGIYDGGDHRRVSLSAFRSNPVARPLPTPSGRIELSSSAYAEAGGPAVPAYRGVAGNPRFPLRLVSPHARYRINSQNAQARWATSREPQRLTVHPDDAGARGIDSDSWVVVESEVGRVRCRVEVTDRITPGVVSLPAGMWPSLRSDEALDSSGAANYLTSTEPTRPSMGSRTHTVFVELRADS